MLPNVTLGPNLEELPIGGEAAENLNKTHCSTENNLKMHENRGINGNSIHERHCSNGSDSPVLNMSASLLLNNYQASFLPSNPSKRRLSDINIRADQEGIPLKKRSARGPEWCKMVNLNGACDEQLTPPWSPNGTPQGSTCGDIPATSTDALNRSMDEEIDVESTSPGPTDIAEQEQRSSEMETPQEFSSSPPTCSPSSNPTDIFLAMMSQWAAPSTQTVNGGGPADLGATPNPVQLMSLLSPGFSPTLSALLPNFKAMPVATSPLIAQALMTFLQQQQQQQHLLNNIPPTLLSYLAYATTLAGSAGAQQSEPGSCSSSRPNSSSPPSAASTIKSEPQLLKNDFSRHGIPSLPPLIDSRQLLKPKPKLSNLTSMSPTTKSCKPAQDTKPKPITSTDSSLRPPPKQQQPAFHNPPKFSVDIVLNTVINRPEEDLHVETLLTPAPLPPLNPRNKDNFLFDGEVIRKSGSKNYQPLSRDRRMEANARERIRVHTIGAAFDALRRLMPAAIGDPGTLEQNAKLSKLSILRIASKYILLLASVNGLDYSEGQNSYTVDECIDLLNDTICQETKSLRR